MTEPLRKKRRVAVIGSGLAGLTTAYLLRQEGAEVWLIERDLQSDRLGFHSASLEIPRHETSNRIDDFAGREENYLQGKKAEWRGQGAGNASRKWVVDVPMRSFQGGYYPKLIALYRHLGIPIRATYFTFSFSHLLTRYRATSSRAADISTYFIHSGASGLSLPSLPTQAFRSARHLARAFLNFLGLAVSYLLWLIIAFLGWHDLLPLQKGRQITLSQLTSTVSYHLSYPFASFPSFLPIPSKLRTPFGAIFTAFIHDIVIPIYSAVGTMTTTDVLDTPVGCILDYAHSTVGTPHYTLGQGYTAASVAERLVKGLREQGDGHLRLGEQVLDMQYISSGNMDEQQGGAIRIRWKLGEELDVDQVVVATQASAAIPLLGMLEASLAKAGLKGEKQRIAGMRLALKEVEYRETIVVTHRDWSILPPSPADQREINLTTPLLSPPPSQHKTAQQLNLDPDLAASEPPSLSSSTSPSPASSSGPPTPLPTTPFFHPEPDRIYTMGTHIIQPSAALRQKGERAVLQTTNPVCAIDPDTVIGVSRLERALPLRNSDMFKRLHPASSMDDSGSPLMLLAGSYAHPGIPLLEGCVASAIRAVETILAEGGAMRRKEEVGGVDWDMGRGGYVGRLWRYRRPGVII